MMDTAETSTGFDDEPTVIDVRSDEFFAPEPPPLPFELTRKKSSEESWMLGLSPEATAILAMASVRAPSWPIAPRLPGAVARPIR